MERNSRRVAAFAIARWLLTKDFAPSLIPDGPDRAFVQDLVYTTIRRLRSLRKVLGELVKKWPKGELEALLYIGAAQILYMDEVPDFAAVNETVDAAKSCGNPQIAKVVNGVLRNLIRRREEFVKLLESAPLAECESYPTRLVARWIDRFGEENAVKLCAWHNTPAKTYLARKDGSWTELERGMKVEEVSGFKEGEFIVQDRATKVAIDLMDVKPGESVLDACAAPGGKAIQLAWRGAKLTACEVNPKRRARMLENFKRTNVEAAIISSLEGIGSFDKVLVDAPCSNTGVLRRRVDARWNWSEEKLASLVKLQSEILTLASKLVKVNGLLVYSTCSNEKEENEEQVKEFLNIHPEFECVAMKELLPFESETDGAFAAALRKVGG